MNNLENSEGLQEGVWGLKTRIRIPKRKVIENFNTAMRIEKRMATQTMNHHLEGNTSPCFT